MTIQLDLKHSRVSLKNLNKAYAKFKNLKLPSFHTYRENLSFIRGIAKKYSHISNIIVIGNGGSVTSFKAYYTALAKYNVIKRVEFVTTMEPDFLNELKENYPKNDTLIVVVSKSGNTVSVIESLLYFQGYEKIAVTTIGKGALFEVAIKNNFPAINHPDIGGRYSGLTASALFPAVLLGLDIDKIIAGARKIYNLCNTEAKINENIAFKLAYTLYELDKKGFTEIFTPIYSTKLVGFLPLLMQLIHESSGKNGKGQTLFGDLAPESQHHTNQRFFGGKKNILGLFVTVKYQDDIKTKVNVPKKLWKIKLRDGKLKDLNAITYAKALEFEFLGTYRDAVKNKKPVINLNVDKVDAISVGEFIGLWHYVAMYSALLRGVNPFDQPQVETSKKITFELTRKCRR